MALTVNQATLHAQAFFKAPSTYASGEELRIANSIQTIISSYYKWHWLIAAATNIAVVSGTRDYTMAAGDQNTVFAIQQANLLSGSTELPSLTVFSDPILDRTSTAAQPYAVSLLSPTQVRLFPSPNATYTFQWRKYARPVVFAATSESYQIPDAFTAVAKLGVVWMYLEYADDTRAPGFQKAFYEALAEHKAAELGTVARVRTS